MTIATQYLPPKVEPVRGNAADVWTTETTPIEAVFQEASPIYARWRWLFERDKSAPINLHPDLAALEWERAANAERRPGWIVEASSGAQTGGLAVLLPREICIARGAGIGPEWKARGYRLAGNRLLGVENGDSQRTLLDAVARLIVAERADFLFVEDLDSNHSLWGQLSGLSDRGFTMILPKGIQARHRIRVPRSAEEYWSQFSNARLKSFRRKRARLDPYRVMRATRIDQVADLIDAMLHVSNASWQARHLGRRVSADDTFLQMLVFLAREEALRSYVLYKDDVPTAFLLGTQFNGVYCAEETGYDLAHAGSSPGLVTYLESLDDLISHDPPEWIDFGGGDSHFKQQFSNAASQSGNVLLIPPGMRTQALALFLTGCRTIDRMFRRALSMTGMYESCRRWVRRSTEGRS